MAPPVVFRDGRYNGRTAREWLPDVVAALVKAADPLKIVLFGSFAAGTEGRDSDLDLLVVLPHVKDKFETMLELRRAAVHVPVPLDIIPTRPRRDRPPWGRGGQRAPPRTSTRASAL